MDQKQIEKPGAEEGLIKLLQSHKTELLKTIPLFANLSHGQLRKVAKCVYEYPVSENPGKVIVTEGTRGDEFFVLLEGTALLQQNGKTLGKLSPGDCFGEISLIDGLSRTATVVAETEVRLLGLGRESFLSLLEEVPGLAHELLFALCDHLRKLEKAVSAAKF